MSEKKINPVLKQVLELGPTIVFFLLYLRIKDEVYTYGGTEYSGFIAATIIFVPILLAAMGILWFLTGKLSRIQVFTAFMVIFFGALTAWFNDERFFKMKTSIVNGLFAVILGVGLMRGKSLLKYVMGEVLPMEDEGWMILTKRLAIGFAVLAIANEIVWRTMSTDAWVKIETFGFPLALFLYLWAQIVTLQKYVIEPEAEET
ncbi:inner membrane-spanning protein YciB [Octadecabacter sp. 1_MG-2023]|uniref:inner membrane-spanning protein YciB n=1 Tax=unclassified Octadecabacter TaxID=196158 RepID=UPI001C09FE35|nr:MULTISPECIES: inner membrane-spanning protein YciB [unclassified Octadecabacter]MBU2992778.1 septation protein IspZ [Octadecabacter sp. B2R22]MDO6733771.1 inner membrane-spanning protein YciB [Octadecabacter sp. 1_MG-2023]